MKDGYIRVASASIDTLIGNVKHNANEIKKVLKETREKKAQVVVFPELVLSGYTLEDLFLQNRLLNECLVQLEEIMHDTKGHQQIVVIGLPFHYQNNLYNVSAVLYDGNILEFDLLKYGPHFKVNKNLTIESYKTFKRTECRF